MIEPEIWFERWGGSYMPVHWKGWALLVGAICAFGGMFLLILGLSGGAEWAWWTFPVLVIAMLVVLEPVNRRHSKNK